MDVIGQASKWKEGIQTDRLCGNGSKVRVKRAPIKISIPQNLRLLLEELFFRIESVPSWNPTLVECKTIQPIDEHTDISYQVEIWSNIANKLDHNRFSITHRYVLRLVGE